MTVTVLQKDFGFVVIDNLLPDRIAVASYEKGGGPIAEPTHYGDGRTYEQVVAAHSADAIRVVQLADEDAPDYLMRLSENGGELPPV